MLFSRKMPVHWIFPIFCLAFWLDSSQADEHCSVEKDSHVPEADVRFAYLISLRKNDTDNNGVPSCGLLSRASVQAVLAVEWMVDRLNHANNNTGYVPGITIGFDVFDDCQNGMYASGNALSFLDHWAHNPRVACMPGQTNTHKIGVVGPSLSSTAVPVAGLMKDVFLPVISGSATLTSLSDNSKYPTFFRTVPSDQHQMAMIADILSILHWTYSVIIYEFSEYGTSAKNILMDIAKRKELCIHTTIPLSKSSELPRHLEMIQESAEDNSIAVVFIGGRDAAEGAFWNIDQRLNNGFRRKYGFHFIMSDAVNTDISIFENKAIGQGTLSVAISSMFLNDFYSDTSELLRQVKEQKTQHELLKSFIQDVDEPLFPHGYHTAFIPSTINAVFALAEALRLEHQQACFGEPGMCLALKQRLDTGAMVDAVKTLTLDYSQGQRGVAPDIFIDEGFSLSFDENGDIVYRSQVPSYAIFQYYADEKEYKQVGNYSNGHTVLDVSKLRMLTPSGGESPTIPPSVCKDRCDECLSQGQEVIAFMEGDAYILGVFSLHEGHSTDPFQCGVFRDIANDAISAEGFLYAVKELRKITNINFGAIAIDDCYSPLRITSLLADFFSGIMRSVSERFSHHILRDQLVGVVACLSSGCTIPTASFFMPQNVPVVSYAASSPDLDDKVDFPYFLRTVPSDVYQASVMVDIVQKMGWEYVGLLYVKNNYGTKGMEAFKSLAMQENSGICVGAEAWIREKPSEDKDEKELSDAWQELTTKAVKVVIFFGIDVRFSDFLKMMEKNSRIGDFIFLASEEWGNNQRILKSGENAARGSLTLKLQSIGLESEAAFRQHLASKAPSAGDPNIWFLEFWQHHFDCNFEGGFNNMFSRDCDPSWKLNPEDVQELSKDERLRHVMNAVYALGKGLGEAKETLCRDGFPCRYLRQYAEVVVTKIRQQTRKEGIYNMSVFDQSGNGAIGFVLYNIQRTSRGYEYIPVGSFNKQETTFQHDKLLFYDAPGNPRQKLHANCTQALCQHCPKAKPTPTEPELSSKTSSDDDYRNSDIVVISLIVVLILAFLVVVAVLVLCCSRRFKALEKRLDNQNEQIYDLPERQVYQGDYIPHGGLAFSEESPYNFNYNMRARPSVNGGVNNPNFEGDNLDSVSQIMLRRRTLNEALVDTHNSTQPSSVQHPASPAPLYSRKSLPVSHLVNSNNAQDNVTAQPTSNYQGSSDDLSMSTVAVPRSFSSTQTTTHSNFPSNNHSNKSFSAVSTGATSAPDYPSNNLHVMIPPTPSEGLVYYMAGPDGQLSAHVSQRPDISSPPGGLPYSADAIAQPQRQQSVGPGSSVKSHNSSIHPEYGPYSHAEALKRQQEKNQRNNAISQNTALHMQPTLSDAFPQQNVQAVPTTRVTQNQALPGSGLCHPLSGEHYPIQHANPELNTEGILNTQYPGRFEPQFSGTGPYSGVIPHMPPSSVILQDGIVSAADQHAFQHMRQSLDQPRNMTTDARFEEADPQDSPILHIRNKGDFGSVNSLSSIPDVVGHHVLATRDQYDPLDPNVTRDGIDLDSVVLAPKVDVANGLHGHSSDLQSLGNNKKSLVRNTADLEVSRV